MLLLVGLGNPGPNNTNNSFVKFLIVFNFFDAIEKLFTVKSFQTPPQLFSNNISIYKD